MPAPLLSPTPPTGLMAPPPEPADAGPRLLGDIGATYARFTVERVRGRFDHAAVLACADFEGVVPMVRAYLDTVPDVTPQQGAFAIAYPIDGDAVRMTNRDWAFSIEAVQQALGLSTLLVVNNFTALAMALPGLTPDERHTVGGGAATPDGVIGLLGPGTGLGVSALIPANDRYVSLASEGGHASFAPSDERELKVLRHGWRTLPHVSAERLVSGPGIELIYEALRDGDPSAPPHLGTADIVQRARDGAHPLCSDTIDCFCAMLGTVAADLALTFGATGGVYIGGGIVPRLGELFERSSFRQRFESKGRFSGFLARIPTHVLTADDLTFRGVSSLLDDHGPGRDGANPLLDRIRQARDGLSPAERRVANVVLESPRAVLNDPVGEISRRAQVSQPTVIRFCRSLGFEGLADFKLKLGAGLTGTVPVQRTQVRRQDGTSDLCAKVLDNTVTSIVQFRDTVNVEAIDRATALLREAARVELFAVGDTAMVALDAQHKLFRLRIPVVARTDPSVFTAAADVLGPRDVALLISASGHTPDLLRTADTARARGAAVIAITATQSPLARKAHLCIAVDHGEDSSTFVAMISRILHLLVIDLLSVGLAVQKPNAPAPGVWISHIG